MSVRAIRAAGYERLGVLESDVRASPQITPQLRAITRTVRRVDQPRVTRRVVGETEMGPVVESTEHRAPYGPGGDLQTAWPHYLAASEAEEARKVLAVRASIPAICSKALPIEAFCLAASVSPLRILEILTATCVRMGAQASTLIAAINHPRVVEKTVEMALTDAGTEDRATLHKHAGFLPIARGPQTTVNVNASASANAAAQVVAAPPPEQTIRRLTDRFNAIRGITITQPALEAAQDAIPATVIHDAELVEVEAESESGPGDE